MAARKFGRVGPALLLSTSVLTTVGALSTTPASAAVKAAAVPAKADYTLVLSKPADANCGLTTLDGAALSIRAGVATLVVPTALKLKGTIQRKGATFTILASAKQKYVTTSVILTGKVNAHHFLVGKSELGGAFAGGTGYACNFPFTGLLLPTAKTPCPTAKALYAVWRAHKPAPGPGVTGFGPVTCWRTWAVAHVRGRADGSVAFSRVPNLHMNSAAEGAAFHQQVCNTASAPKRWQSPDVAGCF